MTGLNITCPHCGFSKNVERQRFPAEVKSIKCPICHKSFAPEIIERAAPDQHPESPPSRTSESSVVRNRATDEGSDFESSSQAKFCSTCGQRIHPRAEICPKCGVRVAPPPNGINKVALLLITFFLGGMGAHKFYQKKYLAGTLYLLFCWTYIPSVIAFVEFIIYAFKSEADLQQKYPETSSGAIILAVVFSFVGIAIIGILAAIAIPQFAAYREKAFNAAASSDLRACKTQAEAYYAQHSAYPIHSNQMQCRASKDVALYFLSFGPDEYRLISFHDRGKKAFLNTSSGGEILEASREEIERQVESNFGQVALNRDFHFIE